MTLAPKHTTQAVAPSAVMAIADGSPFGIATGVPVYCSALATLIGVTLLHVGDRGRRDRLAQAGRSVGGDRDGLRRAGRLQSGTPGVLVAGRLIGVTLPE